MNTCEQNRQNLFCVEFDVDPNSAESSFLHNLDQSMVESHLQFKLNGRIHTKNVFLKDLDFALNGKKIVKSIQSRLENYANFLFKHKRAGYGNYESFNDFKGSIRLKKRHFFIKFINITQSFGMKIEVCPQTHPSFKRINLFTANFNKIVKAGIKIKSFIFTFNIPSNDLVVRDLMPVNYDTMSADSVYSSQDSYISPVDLSHGDSVNSQAEMRTEPRISVKKLSTKSKSY